MKNAAKCDTWCELQNPANHRVFERKLRPKPSGRGHVCLGVTQPSPPTPSPRGGGSGGGRWPPVCSAHAAGPKAESSAATATAIGGWKTLGHGRGRTSAERDPETPERSQRNAPTATPGQAGTPAEFKHINKRRKRNLPGFP
ncbi:hypothetical protein MANES_S044316v8 [Manihot esculenta]|uniref:Uncharacterized protein n=2 Tax=Manihot esculenta TaxID=3983 RepID=A0ACB7FWE7_MANES|nr:hypothetical protein MANES_S034516v8 [Manihot esculenta]KAG8611942.1 hypothetical protein MANES_S044316v8 [Manihot esculenta]